MMNLRRMVSHHKAGTCLRETVRDAFLDEIERMRAWSRELGRQLGEVTLGNTNEGRVAREFDQAAGEVERAARAGRFQESLGFIDAASELLDTLEEISLAQSAIGRTETKILELEALLSNAPCDAIEDFHILMIRARGFYEGGKYRTARFIAKVCQQDVERLTAPAPDDQAPPVGLDARLERQRAVADTLDALGIGAVDAARIRVGTAAIERALSKRYLELSQVLMLDIETVTAPIETFLSQMQLRAGRAVLAGKAPVIQLQDGRIDWRGAAASLAAESLTDISKRLAHRALAAGIG